MLRAPNLQRGTASKIKGIIPHTISLVFRHEHDKTNVTRADAQSWISQQQKNRESPKNRKKIASTGS
ncbi:hypothetical protein BSPA111_10400 [Buttiauxella sp. A111]|nr:hypothetical protein BSPA111_10400 [Buttiauxella sp. A111]